MELRDLARRILASPSIEAKLEPPADPLADEDPGPPVVWETPARPPHLRVRNKRTRVPRPKEATLRDPRKRGLLLHYFANHELQALELMAFAILAFPQAPRAFRAGVAATLLDEQRHLGLYLARMSALGVAFGELPVSDMFWAKARSFATPLHYVAALSLTFEGANLDFAQHYEDLFRAVGDEESAALMRAVNEDEVRHVRFGATWLKRLKDPAESDFQAYARHLVFPLRPAKSRGPGFRREARRQAGLDDAFIDAVEAAPE